MTTRRTFLTLALAAPMAATFAERAAAGVAPVYANDGIAVDGTDVVGYFMQGAPIAGRTDITLDWGGATWRFASVAHRDLFAADPDAYAPQYGGYCAWAVSRNYTAATTPEAWKIVDGRLYLNYSLRIRARWERDIPRRIRLANANWPRLIA